MLKWWENEQILNVVNNLDCQIQRKKFVSRLTQIKHWRTEKKTDCGESVPDDGNKLGLFFLSLPFCPHLYWILQDLQPTPEKEYCSDIFHSSGFHSQTYTVILHWILIPHLTQKLGFTLISGDPATGTIKHSTFFRKQCLLNRPIKMILFNCTIYSHQYSTNMLI